MSVNDVTGDRLVSAVPTEAYKNGWDAIFGSKKQCEGCDGQCSNEQRSCEYKLDNGWVVKLRRDGAGIVLGEGWDG